MQPQRRKSACRMMSTYCRNNFRVLKLSRTLWIFVDNAQCCRQRCPSRGMLAFGGSMCAHEGAFLAALPTSLIGAAPRCGSVIMEQLRGSFTDMAEQVSTTRTGALHDSVHWPGAC
eukprot:scaffold271803_cov23-Tisochrysis_lutea.AAC.1